MRFLDILGESMILCGAHVICKKLICNVANWQEGLQAAGSVGSEGFEGDALLEANMHADMRPSHEDSLALLFFPNTNSNASSSPGDSQIWRAESTASEPTTSEPALAAAAKRVAAMQSAGSLPAELLPAVSVPSGSGVIPAHYALPAGSRQHLRSFSSKGSNASSSERAPLVAGSPQQQQGKKQGVAAELYGPNGRLYWASPAGQRQRRARAESSGSLAATPPRRSFVKFPSAKDGSPQRQSRAAPGDDRV